MDFKKRTVVPQPTDKEWIHISAGGLSNAIKVNGNWTLPNCVGYVIGRIIENLGYLPKNTPNCNAEDWFGWTKDGFKRGQTPKVGAAICWRRGKTFCSADGCGHVAMVEEVFENGDILISESAYREPHGATNWFPNWRMKRLTKASNYYEYAGYTFQGFIYYSDAPVAASPTQSSGFKRGDVVRLTKDAVWSNGVGVARFVFNKDLFITNVVFSGTKEILVTSIQGVDGVVTGMLEPRFVTKKGTVIVPESSPQTNKDLTIKLGDTVQFTGKMHYVASTTKAKGCAAKPCKARVTHINLKGDYKYHIQGPLVYGWVREEDIEKC